VRGETHLGKWQGPLGCDVHSVKHMVYLKNDVAKSFPGKGELIWTTAYL